MCTLSPVTDKCPTWGSRNYFMTKSLRKICGPAEDQTRQLNTRQMVHPTDLAGLACISLSGMQEKTYPGMFRNTSINSVCKSILKTICSLHICQKWFWGSAGLLSSKCPLSKWAEMDDVLSLQIHTWEFWTDHLQVIPMRKQIEGTLKPISFLQTLVEYEIRVWK